MRNQVLIVDDMKENIDILMYSLKGHYSIMAAHSGETALKLMTRKHPDLVLLDVNMPGMSGYDVLKHIKAIPALHHIPVMFVTAEHDAYSEEKGLILGAVDYIHKPFNMAVVNAKVHNQLAIKKDRDQLESLLVKRTEQLRTSHELIIMGMSLLSECHDKVASHHITRIKEYTRILATDIQKRHPDLLTPQQVELIVLFSPLHDVGKASIPSHILNKPDRLTPEEFIKMTDHTLAGAELLRKTEMFITDGQNSTDLAVAIEIAQYHHEKFDGTGYPHRTKGKDIPLSARIVTLSDVYDALRSTRPYKDPYNHLEATNIILQGDERTKPCHFDPLILETFEHLHEKFEQAYNL